MYFSVCLAKFKHLAVQFILQWLHKHWEQGFRERGELERGGGRASKGPYLQFLLQFIVLSLQCVLLSGQLLFGLCLNHGLFLRSTQVRIKPDRKRRSRKVSTLTLANTAFTFTHI